MKHLMRFQPCHPVVRVVGLLCALSLTATACADAMRPTLTADAIGETATAAPDGSAAGAAGTTEQPASDTAIETAPTVAAALVDPTAPQVEQLVVEVIESFPHDQNSFTQGLELHDGMFIESTGLYGESELRRVVPATGEVTQSVPIADEFFAEGMTRVGDQLIQLTWQENTAFYYDFTSFERIKQVSYTGEGWGICYDGSRLVMSDGTPVLRFRDPDTFDEIGSISVTFNGQDVFNLNEVECVNGSVWANIWQTDLIVRIDPGSGAVTGIVDAASLDAPTEPEAAVLNGIAWDESTQSFYVTGKLWPTMYRVNFVPAPTN